MARFTVRIELRDAQNPEAYHALHRAMEEQGFTRVLKAGEGKQYHLPAGEYRMSGRRTRAQVRTLARRGAASMACGILVTEGPCSWYNLDSAASPVRSKRH